MKTPRSFLIAECVFIFGLLPATLSLLRPHNLIYLTLWLMAGFCGYCLKESHAYHFRKDWNEAALNRAVLGKIALRFIPFAAIMLLFTWAMIPARLFSLPLEKPLVWLMIMTLYPLLSVFPQEIIYRSFFFRRYVILFPDARTRILASALAFGWLHILMQNWVAVSFSMVGGMLFAHTYDKTRSLAVVCFEHALYGCWLFTIGMGYYFYHGMALR